MDKKSKVVTGTQKWPNRQCWFHKQRKVAYKREEALYLLLFADQFKDVIILFLAPFPFPGWEQSTPSLF